MSGLRQINWKEFEKFLSAAGCVFVREKGDHRIWRRDGLKRSIIVPRYRPLPTFIIKNNLRLLGISTAEYLSIVEKR